MTPMGWLVFALSTSVKALLVLTAAYGLTRLMRDRPASERHLVWMLASVCVLAMPLLSLATPGLRIGVPGPWGNVLAQPRPVQGMLPPLEVDVVVAPLPRAERISRALGAPALAPVTPAAPVQRAAAATVRARPAAARGAPPVEPATAVQPGTPTQPIRPDRSGMPLFLLLIWLGGSLVVLARMVVGFVHVRRMAQRAAPLLDPVLLVRMHGIAAQMGVTRPVYALEGDVHAMPITFGIVRATLLLPSTGPTWSAARQDAVLRHELAHIRRRDSLSQLIVELGCALYWFNPLMWWASRRMCVEREHACDDAVLASGSRASDYAAELLEIARTLRTQHGTTLAAIAMARPSHLRERVTSLFDPRPRYERASMKLLVPAWVGAFMLITPLSSLAPEIGGRLGPGQSSPQGTVTATADATEAPRKSKKGPDATTALTPWDAAPPELLSEPHASSSGAPLPLPEPSMWPSPHAMPALDAVSGEPVLHALNSSIGSLFSPLSHEDEVQQDDCLTGRNTSINSNSNDDRRTIKWSGNGCSGEVLMEGDIRFDPDFANIIGISRGGQFRITTEEGRTERRVTITPANGGVAYDYRVDGDRRELDAAGREWLASTMTFLFRRLGFMADERATAILERGGANALLTEVGLLRGDHVRSRYLAILIERGRLDEAVLGRVLTLAGNTIDSDHYRTQIITAAAGNYDFTEGVRTAYIEAISGMESDHYRHVAFSTLLEKGRLSDAQASAVLRETSRIESDHYRAELLDEMADSYSSNPDIRAAYLEAAGGIESDHYKTNVLTRLFTLGGMSSAELARVVDAAGTIESDHYRAEVLSHVAGGGLTDAALQQAFVRAADGIESDHYLQSVLSHLAARDRLDNATMMGLLDAAGGIESDHYRSELLIDIAERHRLTGDARTRFERLMQDMDSDTYRGRVAAALLRNGR